MNDQNARAAFAIGATATAATATATSPTPSAIGRIYITLLVISYSAVTAGAATCTVGDGTTTFVIEVPAGVAGAPSVPIVIPFPVAVPFKPAAAVTAVLTTGGAAVVGSVVLAGYIGQ